MIARALSVIALSAVVVSVTVASGRRQAARPERADSSLAAHSAPAPPTLRVGAPVPRFATRTLRGDSVALGGSADSITLVNVWATWCASCREEMEDLEQLHEAYVGRGVRVVAVSIDAGSETLVRRFVDRERLSFAVAHDQAGRLQSLYHVAGVPSTYLIGRDGTLFWQHTGGLHGSVHLARSAIDAVIAATVTRALRANDDTF